MNSQRSHFVPAALAIAMATAVAGGAWAQSGRSDATQPVPTQSSGQTNTPSGDSKPMRTQIMNTEGKSVGTLQLQQVQRGVLIDIRLQGLPAGVHAMHIHETGTCDADNGFKGAGGHLAGSNKHGYLAQGGPHPGDLPNFRVPPDGDVHIEILNNMVTLEGGDHPLLDDDGSALIIHAKADDYMSQPAGAAGDRMACAKITSAG